MMAIFWLLHIFLICLNIFLVFTHLPPFQSLTPRCLKTSLLHFLRLLVSSKRKFFSNGRLTPCLVMTSLTVKVLQVLQNRQEHSNFLNREARQCAPQEFPTSTGVQIIQNMSRQIFCQNFLQVCFEHL